MTGVVIAGFGSDDYFPGYIHAACYGFLGDKLIVTDMKEEVIDGDNISKIEAFAQIEMAETFMTGVSPEVISIINQATTDCIQTVVTELQASGATLPTDWDKRSAQISREHWQQWMKKAIDLHWHPLSRVVGALPIEDMAVLAETLVSLASLKER
jgi:hypothetical protein